MDGKLRVLLRIGLFAVVGIAGVSLCFTARKGAESDLFALIGTSAEVTELRLAAGAMAKSAHFLVKAESEEAARARLVELGVFGGEQGKGNGGRLSATGKMPVVPVAEPGARNTELSTLLTSLAPYARGFLSPATRMLLEAGEFAAVRDAAMARMFSPMPPVLPLAKDPFLLFTDYVLEMSSPKGEWVMVNVELTPAQALAALEAVKGAEDVRCAGTPFHTAVASERSKREINVLSAISLFCVILFGWLLTRSFRFVPVLLGALVAAFCVAAAALFAVFPKPHLITFVFGTTLIGLSVDYVYHAMTARGSIAKPLTFSFLSTAVCFLPLLFSKVGVLNQMALFTLAGLATVYAGVLAFGRKGGGSEGHTPSSLRDAPPVSGGEFPSPSSLRDAPPVSGGESTEGTHPRWRLAVAGLVGMGPLFAALCCVCRGLIPMPGGVDISRFYRPDPYLAEGERIAAAATGGAGFIPSAAEQRRNARLVRRLYKVEGANLCVMTGLPEKVLALPAEFKAFDPKGAIEDLFAAWEREARNLLLIALLALCAVLAVLFRRACLDFILPIWVAYCATEGLLIFMGETLNFFAVIGFFIFIGLGLDYCVFRWHARQNPHGPTENAVWYSFLTSLVAFGMLGFTEFAVTRLMGIILAFGLAVAYLAAKLCCGRSCFLPPNGQDGRCPRDVLDRGGCPTGRTGVPPVRNGQDARCPSGAQFSALNPQSAFAKVSVDKPSTPWHEQKEQCASRFWMQFMWYSYAWFGKTFQKLVFLFAIPFIYFFSKPARAALRKFYGVLSEYTGRPVPATHGRMFRHVLGFAWSLMDKTDAATLKKDLPEMSVRDDDGWRAFKGLVDSGKGAFILCTHVGVIGVLPALENVKCKMENVKCAPPKVHAFQQMGHDAVFMRVYLKHFDRSKIELHAVEEIGVETAVEMQAAIRRGELVIMAGDRTSAGSKSVLRHRFLGRDCVWPKGAFKFAALMEAPVFGVTCIHTGWNRYEVHVAALSGETLLADYVRFLEAETVAHPEQWYQFYDFFGGGDA